MTECPECGASQDLRLDVCTGNWDCVACGWSTEPDAADALAVARALMGLIEEGFHIDNDWPAHAAKTFEDCKRQLDQWRKP